MNCGSCSWNESDEDGLCVIGVVLSCGVCPRFGMGSNKLISFEEKSEEEIKP